jgi:hypothetical protein
LTRFGPGATIAAMPKKSSKRGVPAVITESSRSKPKAKPKSTGECLVVASKVKAHVKSLGLRSDGDLVDAVSDQVRALLKKAADRVKARNRGTITPVDL